MKIAKGYRVMKEYNEQLKVVIINKSDTTGGAAMVSRRLGEALIEAGAEVNMIVAEKNTNLPWVVKAANDYELKISFIAERLKIFIRNGFNRKTLFKIDTASDGINLSRHPLVKDADVICLNWINQGLLSLRDIEKIAKLGKPIVWTMHDMWNMTGICHHAGNCNHFEKQCGDCPLLGKLASKKDMSYRTWLRKSALYKKAKIQFVAVSNWLAGRAADSSLLQHENVMVIPNAFPLKETKPSGLKDNKEIKIVFGAARLDDPIKGFPILIKMTNIIKQRNPGLAAKLHLVTFGNIKDASLLDEIGIRHTHLGRIEGEEKIRNIYKESHIVVSTSLYETLPGTLVEGQAYGCIPISFDRGGQSDIISHQQTGWLASFREDTDTAAANIAEGIEWAAEKIADSAAYETILTEMFENVQTRFAAPAVARRYLTLFENLLKK